MTSGGSSFPAAVKSRSTSLPSRGGNRCGRTIRPLRLMFVILRLCALQPLRWSPRRLLCTPWATPGARLPGEGANSRRRSSRRFVGSRKSSRPEARSSPRVVSERADARTARDGWGSRACRNRSPAGRGGRRSDGIRSCSQEWSFVDDRRDVGSSAPGCTKLAGKDSLVANGGVAIRGSPSGLGTDCNDRRQNKQSRFFFLQQGGAGITDGCKDHPEPWPGSAYPGCSHPRRLA